MTPRAARTPAAPSRVAPSLWSSLRPWAGFMLAAAWFALVALCALEARAAEPAAAPAVFARVGDAVVTQQEFDTAFAAAARGKFYHGKPPEGEVARLQRDVSAQLVNDLLLQKEARRRKLQPDAAGIQKTIDGYEQRYKSSEQWQKNRAQLLPGLRHRLEAESLVAQLDKSVRAVGEPTPKQLEAYYEAHKDKFTEPEQLRLSMILLKVDPSSPQAKWDGARSEGAAIVKRLRGGADFAEAARLHSGDASADKGGDMGYVHRGMLPEPAQVALDKMKPGELSEPVVLLEGVAVLRLDERKNAQLNPLAKVRERAHDLWVRDRGEEAWTALIARLRRETAVQVDESRFLPLTAQAGQATTAGAR